MKLLPNLSTFEPVDIKNSVDETSFTEVYSLFMKNTLATTKPVAAIKNKARTMMKTHIILLTSWPALFLLKSANRLSFFAVPFLESFFFVSLFLNCLMFPFSFFIGYKLMREFKRIHFSPVYFFYDQSAMVLNL